MCSQCLSHPRHTGRVVLEEFVEGAIGHSGDDGVGNDLRVPQLAHPQLEGIAGGHLVDLVGHHLRGLGGSRVGAGRVAGTETCAGTQAEQSPA